MNLAPQAPASPWIRLLREFVPVVMDGTPIRNFQTARTLLAMAGTDTLHALRAKAMRNASEWEVKIDHLRYTIQGAGGGVCWVSVYGFPSGVPVPVAAH